ncbi:MAG: tRNA pseudouridine(55) synthase TruB [Bacteroidetes bacterium]|nr:tRNA pseudouridine(55) synthase TruB [Bacteroidota bacterium]
MKTTHPTELNKIYQIPSPEELREEGSVILVNKPMTWSSFDVVKKIRIHFGVKKVGHAGTLDPMATGLLIICTGKKTKEMHRFVNLEKEYIGVMVLGAKTLSYDSETEITETGDVTNISLSDIQSVFNEFTGALQQKPPIYSALKYGGKPLYKYARTGLSLELKAREVFVKELEIINFNIPEIKFRAVCSKGTYIRSLVNDIGLRLGCGAYLKSLDRIRIGDYNLADAFTIEELTVRSN